MVSDAERDAAVAAVLAASALGKRVQGRLSFDDTLRKGDDSPVTIVDFAAQAVVCSMLAESLGDVAVLREEDSAVLRTAAGSSALDRVVELVRSQRGDAASAEKVLGWIGTGASVPLGRRYWTLDPIDGTKGFLRGEQYAVALALVEDGVVVLGVLGCPNLANTDGSVGATFVAVSGRCDVLTAGGTAPVRVSPPASVADARICESVESAHSDHQRSAQIAARLGITAPPIRMDSQCKYGVVARGDASIYLRLPIGRGDRATEGKREHVWDHAAGSFVVEQAGGRVTDLHGAALDFSHGARLERNHGVVATDGRFHDAVLDAVRAALGDH